jgi:hypothetical protein
MIMILRTFIARLQAFQQEMDAAGVSDENQEVMVNTTTVDLGNESDELASGAYPTEIRLAIHPSGKEGMVVIEV